MPAHAERPREASPARRRVGPSLAASPPRRQGSEQAEALAGGARVSQVGSDAARALSARAPPASPLAHRPPRRRQQPSPRAPRRGHQRQGPGGELAARRRRRRVPVEGEAPDEPAPASPSLLPQQGAGATPAPGRRRRAATRRRRRPRPEPHPRAFPAPIRADRPGRPRARACAPEAAGEPRAHPAALRPDPERGARRRSRASLARPSRRQARGRTEGCRASNRPSGGGGTGAG